MERQEKSPPREVLLTRSPLNRAGCHRPVWLAGAQVCIEHRQKSCQPNAPRREIGTPLTCNSLAAFLVQIAVRCYRVGVLRRKTQHRRTSAERLTQILSAAVKYWNEGIHSGTLLWLPPFSA